MLRSRCDSKAAASSRSFRTKRIRASLPLRRRSITRALEEVLERRARGRRCSSFSITSRIRTISVRSSAPPKRSRRTRSSSPNAAAPASTQRCAKPQPGRPPTSRSSGSRTSRRAYGRSRMPGLWVAGADPRDGGDPLRPGRPAGGPGARHRRRGGRHLPGRPQGVRLGPRHPDGRPNRLAECLGGRGCATLRGTPSTGSLLTA